MYPYEISSPPHELSYLELFKISQLNMLHVKITLRKPWDSSMKRDGS